MSISDTLFSLIQTRHQALVKDWTAELPSSAELPLEGYDRERLIASPVLGRSWA